MVASSFLDLEACHNEGKADCNDTHIDESQGSLVDFLYDNTDSGDDQQHDIDMRCVYMTSLLPISQQPEGFGFCAPKYNTKGFKLRKKEVEQAQSSSSLASDSSQSSLPCPTAILHHTLPPISAVLQNPDHLEVMPRVTLQNRMRLKRKS
jgi:hypothetical protein